MSAAPTLSLVITSLTPGPQLRKAVDGIGQQRWVEPEVIVAAVELDSPTVAWLETRQPPVKIIRLAPGTSCGQAHNQAIAVASGDWILFMDAQDRLVGDMILSETLNWSKQTEAGVVSGEAAGDDGRLHRFRSRVNPIAGDFAPAAATFYRRSLFDENGSFDPAYTVMAGYEFHLRLWKNRVRFKPIPLRIAACAPAEPFTWLAAQEEIRARHAYYEAWRCWPWDLLSMLRAIRPSGRTAASPAA